MTSSEPDVIDFASRHRRRLTALARGAVALVAVAVAVAVAELTLHVAWTPPAETLRFGETGIYRPDSELGWRFQENYTTTRTVDGRTVVVRTNARGFRDRDHGPATRPRVLFLGDSFTFGWGVEPEEMYTAHLQHRLPAIEIVNLGGPAWQVKQYHRLLQIEGAARDPIVVVVALVQNDITDQVIPPPGDPRGLDAVREQNSVYVDDLLRVIAHQSRPVFRFLAFAGLAELGGYWLLDDNLRPSLRDQPPELTRAWAATLAELSALRDTTKNLGASLLVATIPAKQALDRKALDTSLVRVTYEADDFEVAGPYQRIEAWCQARQVRCVNGYEALRRSPGRLYFATDLHFSPAGHRAFAEALVTALEELVHERRPVGSETDAHTERR